MPSKWVEIEDRKINECGGCRKDIPERHVFRCADCGLPFHQTCLDQHCKHGNQKQELRSENLFLKQQVANLEEYMLRGVAFRDGLQAQLCAAGKLCENVEIICINISSAYPEFAMRPTDRDVRDWWGEMSAALSSPTPCPHEARVKELERILDDMPAVMCGYKSYWQETFDKVKRDELLDSVSAHLKNWRIWYGTAKG
jgi:hypothetical protein